MRNQLGAFLDELAMDDRIKVVLLRGEAGVFSTGADMGNAYSWYESNGDTGNGQRRRPSQRRRLSVDRKTFSFYHDLIGYPKVTVAEVRGYALGGGLELALMADIAVVARDTVIGTPATRFLGPALGSLHLFFHRVRFRGEAIGLASLPKLLVNLVVADVARRLCKADCMLGVFAVLVKLAL